VVIVGNTMRRCAIGGVSITDEFEVPTNRVLIANNVFTLTGAAKTTAEDSGWPIEIVLKSTHADPTRKSMSDIDVFNNRIQQSMSHAIAVQPFPSGNGSISNLRFIGNTIQGGVGSSYWTGGMGIFFNRAVFNCDIINNKIIDVRGQGIKGITGSSFWRVMGNHVISAGRATSGTGGAAIDIQGCGDLTLCDNRVTDTQSPKGSSHAVNLTGSSGWMRDNDFQGAGYTGTFVSLGSMIQTYNRANSGTVYTGPTTGTVLASNLV
jgi:hypothetical protein